MSDLVLGRSVKNMDAEVDSAAVFDLPVGRAGRLTHARLSWSGDQLLRLELTLNIPLDDFVRLETAEAFGNRVAERTDNLRDGFDDSEPVEVALVLDTDALHAHFSGDQAARQTALLAVLEALAGTRPSPLTAPTLWTFESAVQPVPGRGFSAGYRNRTLVDA